MIKHTLTKKQQLVLCAMYVESLGGFTPAVQCYDGSVRTAFNGTADCSAYTMCYLQDYGLVGAYLSGAKRTAWALTSEGEELAKALFKGLS